ncbi:hypothetical protein KILIM_025_00120 [Kineosphaera limosa NBRC 100340]|uniref:Uncharacterized protein n=2 Tax=Kineosphaera TaxID=211469 RepID=K6WPC5_9MICO|nr:hypothetical protein KILIM_025_00120 [Kineosphaera limosa NBRC 100340]
MPVSPTPTAIGDSWAPAPAQHDGLACVAGQVNNRLVLHTVGGDVTFWAGVTLSPTTPGHVTGTRSATRADYRRWLVQMAELGVRVVRLSGLHGSVFYEELLRYNEANAAAPIYLIQGVEVLAADALTGSGLYDSALTQRARAEVLGASAAVHGDLSRRSGSAPVTGTWTADVSPWTIAFVLGTSWQPALLQRTDEANPDAPGVRGRFFTSSAAATPTERWCAARLEELAADLAQRGVSVPLAISASPEIDPLKHPQEPDPQADLVSLDARAVTPTAAWPGGHFAAYVALPYRPLFLFHEPDLQGDDAYRAYLQALQEAFEGIPLFVTSFSVGSGLGSAGNGVNGRDQGHHSEPQMMQLNAEMLSMFASIGLTGATIPWQDDWSASTWNTAERYTQVPAAQRALFHDPLSGEQWRGLITQDSVRSRERVVHEASTDYMQRVTFEHDASWIYLTLYFAGRVTSPVEIGFDMLAGAGLRFPGGSGTPIFDVAIRMVPTMSTTVVFIRSGLDPIRLDGLPRGWWPSTSTGGWNTEQLVLNRGYLVPGSTAPVAPQFLDIGTLLLGSWWDENADDYNSLATWHMARASAQDPAILRFRLPWSMLAMADPAGRQILVPTTVRPTLAVARAINVTIESSTPGSPITFPLGMPTWSTAAYTERIKTGAQTVSTALGDVTRQQPPSATSPSPGTPGTPGAPATTT